jgi:biuret amidohydrolase
MPDIRGLSIPMQLADLCQPSRTALIVYDMQVGVVSQIDEGQAITGRCVELLASARKGGYPVYFTRHRWLPNRLVSSAAP